jgi:hypothetical protein
VSDLLARLDALDDPYRYRSALFDLHLARHGDREAVQRLEKAHLIRQAPPGSTLLADLPGLISANTVPVNQHVRRLLEARSRGHQGLIDAVVTDELPTGSMPWVPSLPVPTPADVQQGEKTGVGDRAISVEGQHVKPDVIIRSADVSFDAISDPGRADILSAVVLADVLAGLAAYLISALEAEATTAASISEAVGSVEDAGWPCDALIGSHTAFGDFLNATPLASSWGAIPIVFVPTASRVLALSRAGVYAATSDTDEMRLTEPHIGGFQIMSIVGVVVDVAENAAAVVDGPIVDEPTGRQGRGTRKGS